MPFSLRRLFSSQSQAVEEPPVVEPFPSNLPVTPETIQELLRDYHLYYVGQEALGVPIQDDGDEDDWNPIDRGRNSQQRENAWAEVRDLTQNQPHCKRALSLYCQYVFGAGFEISVKPRPTVDESSDTVSKQQKQIKHQVDRRWKEFLEANAKHWGPDEFGKRVYRDGEQFTRVFDAEWPTQMRFLDPEEIRGEDDDETRGIVTDETDIATVLEYERYDDELSKVIERIPAEEMFHTRIDCDSTEKRGRSRFISITKIARMLEAFTRNEVTHRNLQSSIVMVRKVDGSASAARLLLDNAQTSTTSYPEQTLSREKIRPGTILTTHRGVEIDFKSPKADFSDASPLGKFLIQHIATATGWTYAMLAATADDGNFASALVQESPVLQMVYSERKFFASEWRPIYRRVIEQAIDEGLIEGVGSAEELWEEFDIDFRWGDVVSRDLLKEAQAANIGVMAQAISRREMARRMQADPEQMSREVVEESEMEHFNQGFNNQNPGGADKQSSSQANAGASGQNQGDDGDVSHDDAAT